MKKDCLIVCVTIIVFIIFVVSIVLLFPEKPASEEKINEVLITTYNNIKDSEALIKKIEILKLLEKNKSIILDAVVIENQNEIYLNLNSSSKLSPQIPERLLNELSVFKSQYLFNEQLKITEDKRFILTNTITDYKNYLFINHSLYFVNTFPHNYNNEKEKYIKTINVGNQLNYTITIRDAFNDIDPNNFAPN